MRPSPLSLRVLVLWTSRWQGYHAVQLLRFLPRDLRPLLALCRLFLLMAALYRRTGLSGMRTMACFICRTCSVICCSMPHLDMMSALLALQQPGSTCKSDLAMSSLLTTSCDLRPCCGSLPGRTAMLLQSHCQEQALEHLLRLLCLPVRQCQSRLPTIQAKLLPLRVIPTAPMPGRPFRTGLCS